MRGWLRQPTVRWLLRIGVTIGILVYILVDVDTGDLVRTLSTVRPGLVAAALVLYLAGQVLSAYKWWILGRSVGFAQRFVAYVRFYFVGMFFNLLGPSTIGGDIVRALYLGDGKRPGLAINSVLFDRVSGLVMLTALGAGALLAFPDYGLPWRLTAAIGGFGALLVLGWWMCPRLVRFLPERNRVRRQIEDELAPFWCDRRLLAHVAGVSLVFHLTQVVIQWMLVRAARAEVPFSYCLVYHPVISVMIALPVSVGGLIGLGGYLYFLERVNLDDSVAVAVGVLWFLVTVLAGLVGGAVFAASGAELPRLRAPAPSDRDASAA